MPFRYMGRVQMSLLPPAPDQQLPLNRPARPVAEFVDAPVRERRRELALEMDGDPLRLSRRPTGVLMGWSNRSRVAALAVSSRWRT